MATSDGNGWVACACGRRHWGRFGAAGLLLLQHGDLDRLHAGETPADARVLLQHRALWSHQGGTWGLPGGARDSHEDVVTAALRETWEETSIKAADAALLGVHRADHGNWSYTTVIMGTGERGSPKVNAESLAAEWVAWSEVPERDLHPGLRAAWPLLTAPRRRLLVDVANVMGSRPDGWWRDRAGGAQRTVDEVGHAAGRMVTAKGELVTLVNAVVEGAGANSVSDDPAVYVTSAATADEYLQEVVGAGDIVVTADGELRRAVSARGADLMGPMALRDALAELA